MDNSPKTFVLSIVAALSFITTITYIQPLLSNINDPWKSYVVLAVYLSVGFLVVVLFGDKFNLKG